MPFLVFYCSVLSKVLQKHDLCVLSAGETFLKIKTKIENIKTTPFDDLPSVKLLCSRVNVDSSGTSYQGTDISNYDAAMQYFRNNYSDLAKQVLRCLHSRIKVLHTELLTHLLTLLTPIGWDKSQDGSFAYSSLDYLINRFQVPLLKRNVNVSLIKEEWDDITNYARRYFNLVQESYRVIWWKLFNYTESGNWTNIIISFSFLFILPACFQWQVRKGLLFDEKYQIDEAY